MEMVEKESSYGRKLRIINSMGIGGCMDAVAEGNRLFVIGKGKTKLVNPAGPKDGFSSGNLYIADITEPMSPRITGILHGLGNTRQVEVRRGVAYVASREDGLFLIDISNPAGPRIISHYDPVEFATGVDLYGSLALVSCRHYGVEIVDVSDATKPRHVSLLRVGEAQSVDACNGYLYAGVWGQKELVVCDIKNPYEPRIAAHIPVDGRGDGVFVKGNYCYIATGHHARGMQSNDVSDPAFGYGNGMEIYDISHPEKPAFVSRIKINRFYRLFNDMWDVTVSGNYALLSHTYNGVFAIDVSDPKSPVFAAQAELPQVEGQEYNSPVGGIAVIDNYIYAAGIQSDLHVMEASGLAKSIAGNTEAGGIEFEVRGQSGRRQPAAVGIYGAVPAFSVYKPEGQVYAAALAEGYAYAACGTSGIHILQTGGKLQKVAEYATQGFALDIKTSGDIVYVAEGYGGLSIWRLFGSSGLKLLGRYTVNGGSVKQVVVPQPGKYALLQVGSQWFHVVNVEKPETPELVYSHTQNTGLIYGRQISDDLAGGRYAACFWHTAGIYWYDIYGGPGPEYSGYCRAQAVSQYNGIAVSKKYTVLTHDKGYVLLDPKDGGDLAQLPHYGVEGFDLTGKPRIYGNTMFVSDRIEGLVTVLDIGDIMKPQVQRCFRIQGNPDFAVICGNRAAIPAGYQGLLIYTLGE